MTYKKRCNNCIHVLCDVVGRQRPERNLEFVCEVISLFEKTYGSDYKEETRELALDAISKYGPGTPFENDERMLPIYRILGKYSRSMSSTDLYDKLHSKRLFTTSATFYVDWAEVYLVSNQIDKAKAILDVMEKAVGAQHASCVQLRNRILLEENTQPQRQRRTSGVSKIAALVKPSEAPSHTARRNLFGSTSSPNNSFDSVFNSQLPAEPIVEEPISTPTASSNSVVPPRDEPIVLPTIVDAPPIDISIVSPSITLLQSGQIPPKFALPPVFSFSNPVHCAAPPLYRPSMHTTTRETSMITGGIMSTSIMPSISETQLLTGLPSHPAQIGQGTFAVPSIPPFRNNEIVRAQSANSENMDPRGVTGSNYPAKRDIAGVLLPSKNVELDPFGELEPETKPMSAIELKKARLQNERNQQTHKSNSAPSSARRMIFPDSTAQLSTAFSSFGLSVPSTSSSSTE